MVLRTMMRFISIKVLALAIIFTRSFSYPDNETKVNTTNDNDDLCDPLYLTPYIEAGNIEAAQKLSRVHLFNTTGLVESYSGYLTVNKSCNANLFFWFFPAQTKNKKAPVILWLQGGPGDTSLYGLFQEIGPFYLYNKNELRLRNYSWNFNSSVLFIDNPVGTGYSFTNNIEECYSKNQDDIRINLYNALVQFYKLFPEFMDNDFFICGESYAGKYVISLGFSIHENNPNSTIKINLKGVGIVSGVVDPINMMGFSDYLNQTGLIDENDTEIQERENITIGLIKDKKWKEAYYSTNEIFLLIKRKTGVSIYNYSKMKSTEDYPYFLPFRDYVTDRRTKCAIHVGNNARMDRNSSYYYLNEDEPQSVKLWVEKLIKNYTMLFFNGQFDLIVGFPLTQKFISRLKWSGKDEYKKSPRKYYKLKNGTVCGYIKSFKNLKVALVRNAGHNVPQDQPECAYELVTNYLLYNHYRNEINP